MFLENIFWCCDKCSQLPATFPKWFHFIAFSFPMLQLASHLTPGPLVSLQICCPRFYFRLFVLLSAQEWDFCWLIAGKRDSFILRPWAFEFHFPRVPKRNLIWMMGSQNSNMPGIFFARFFLFCNSFTIQLEILPRPNLDQFQIFTLVMEPWSEWKFQKKFSQLFFLFKNGYNDMLQFI